MGDIKNVPVIRFKGFKDKWDLEVLKEVCDIYDGIHHTPKYSKSGVIFLSVENIKDLKSKKFISFEDFKKDYKVYPQYGDILMTRIGDVGTANIVLSKEYLAYYVSLALFKNIKLNPAFLLYNIASPSFQKEIFHRTLHIAFPKKINKNEIEKINLYFTENLTEQTQIGNFFKTLDEQINLQEQKHQKLVNLKKAMLEKMFLKEGADTPEIRFKGFTEYNWKEVPIFKYVSKIIDFRGRTPKKLGLDWSDKGFLALSALNVKNGYIDKNLDAHYGNIELYNKWMSGNELQIGQILMTTEAPMGNIARIPDTKKYILSQRTIAFCLDKNKLSESYYAVLLSSPFFYSKLLAISSGGTAKGVSQKTLSQLKINIPENLSEQQKIGDYFENLDNLIQQTQLQLEKHKNIKQALLQKMFV